jgi:hypothetical protein
MITAKPSFQIFYNDTTEDYKMSEPIPTSQDLTENYDANFWGDLLDEQEFRITNLHKQLNWEKYMEWGLTALKAQKNDDSAKSLLPTILAADKEMKKNY